MKQYSNYKLEDFLNDHFFIESVVNPTKQSRDSWNKFLEQYPNKTRDFEKAISFIKSIEPKRNSIQKSKKEQLWLTIISAINDHKHKRKLQIRNWSIAAGIVALISVGGLYLSINQINNEINYAKFKKEVAPPDHTKLILSDESVLEVDQKDSKIEYDKEGNLIVNENQVVNVTTPATSKPGNNLAMNQIVVPRGKRANISFSDGTKMWLNSGSHVIYPVEFGPEKREIYVEGEVYLEVKSNKDWPFIAKTNTVSVRVKGTSFNINAYPDSESTAVVLVEGALEIKDQRKKHSLSPNELFRYDNKTKSCDIQDGINVYEYIGWKDGWLLCNSEKLLSVFEKLSRYYDIEIRIIDKEAENYTISGKLHLKEDIEDVLDVISTTAPIKYTMEDSRVLIYDKNKKLEGP